jgi:hypothetical protein
MGGRCRVGHARLCVGSGFLRCCVPVEFAWRGCRTKACCGCGLSLHVPRDKDPSMSSFTPII